MAAVQGRSSPHHGHWALPKLRRRGRTPCRMSEATEGSDPAVASGYDEGETVVADEGLARHETVRLVRRRRRPRAGGEHRVVAEPAQAHRPPACGQLVAGCSVQ